MFSPIFLLKTATFLSRLSKKSPVAKRHIRRLSTQVAIKAIHKAALEIEEEAPRPCGCGCSCERVG